MTTSTLYSCRSDPAVENRRLIRYWLYSICFLVFAMVVVGGATRLTDSGLSITEWKPLLGIIPPLNDADWQDAFQKYKQIPEYQQVNKGMSLSEFKVIFWWEWAHRFLGRMIGFAFLIPFILFLALGRVEKPLIPKLLGLFLLGGLQGFLGWYMVKSGLVDRVDVSQYRLAAHLGLAFIIFAAAFWLALGLRPENRDKVAPGALGPIPLSAALLVSLIFLQVILGAFVAGTRAGHTYNTWPLMDGHFIPLGFWNISPWYANFFENIVAIQFNHRMMAYALIAYAIIHCFFIWRAAAVPILKWTALAVVIATIAQALLGIWTLLMVVPIELGIAHQSVALIVFAIAIYHLRAVIDTVKYCKPTTPA